MLTSQEIPLSNRLRADRANAQFTKVNRAKDKTPEYETRLAADRAKTARLRALRLARDAAEQVTLAEGQKGKPVK